VSGYRDTLLRMIHQVLSGEWSVDRFQQEYYHFFVDDVPADALSQDDENFFAAVQEKLDWTAHSPTEEERQVGWLDHAEFVQWLRTELDLHGSPKA
jgi:hypothetical protein